MSKVNWTKGMIESLLTMYETHTFKEIAKLLNKRFKVNLTPNSVRKAYERYKLPILEVEEKNKPKILIFDLETTPLLVYTWGLWDQNIGLNQVVKESTILSWCAKWYGEDEVFYMDTSNQKNVRDDKKIVKSLWKLIDEADYVVAHNLNSFDHKVFNARVISNGLKPPSPYKKFDTKIIAKRHFRFMSNKLQHLTDKFGEKYHKSSHGEFPGFSMWEECLKGNKKAFAAMKRYNELDVLSLEEVFNVLLPWESAAIFEAFNNTEKPTCSCGSTNFKKHSKPYSTNANTYELYICKSCGASYRSSKKLSDKKSKVRRTTR